MSEKVGFDIERLRILSRFQSFLKTDFIQIESRSKSEPPLSDIDFKNEMTWAPLKSI